MLKRRHTIYLDWKASARGAYVVDIETDGLDATRIWVMCWRNIRTGETGEETSIEAIQDFFRKTAGSLYIGHNILKFDAPVLCKLANAGLSVGNCIDTLVLSTLYSPSRDGGHSLAAWGEHLGKEKIDFHDWSGLSRDMITYCHRDVEITAELFVRLIKTLMGIGFSELSIWMQHRLTVITDRQQKTGFYFDGPRAIDFYRMLRSREESLGDEIRKAFPPIRTFVADRPMFKKDGASTAIYEKDQIRFIIEEDVETGRYRAYEDIEFGIGSPKQRVDKLLELGWEPLEFTKTGNPKPFDKGKLSPSLEHFVEANPMPEVELIARWMSINGRGNMVNTWLENWNDEDFCIHGRLLVADTLRFKHQSPNTANIPAVRVDKQGNILRNEEGYYTYEARDLWTARPDRLLVGTDAAGLELRMLAHYLNRPDFTDGVVNGDPHQTNADIVGITRPQAKTLIYAVCYGAGDVKIAKTLGLPVYIRETSRGPMEYSPEGKEIKELFLGRLGLSELIALCKEEQSKGRVELVDGSKVICPSPHAALNYKLQGGGARVMGLGSILLDRFIQSEKLDSLKVGDIHDEWQYDCHPSCADTHKLRSVQAIRDAGKHLSLNVPLDGEAKVGRTWAETH